MKSVINSIINLIKESCPQIRYVSRNWNQLSYEQPPVKFPCALVDIDSLQFSEIAHGNSIANGTISVTIADSQLARGSSSSRDFELLDTVTLVADKLQCLSTPDFQPLILVSLSKSYSDKSYDVYTLTFSTSFVHHRSLKPQTAQADPVITI